LDFHGTLPPMSPLHKKTYLGDSVYVEGNEFGQIVLTTNNGHFNDPRNIIVLEPQVYAALVAWVKRRAAEAGRVHS